MKSALTMEVKDIQEYLEANRDRVISECYEFFAAYDRSWEGAL